MSASPDFMQGLLGSLSPWMTGASPSALDRATAQYGGFSGLLAAMMQGAGPNTTQARQGAALSQAQDNALAQAAARQKLVEGGLGLQRQKMMLDAAQQALQGDQGGQGGPPPPAAPPSQTSQTPFLPGISQMPPSGAPSAGSVSSPPAAPPQSGAPSMAQVYGTTFPGGMSPAYTRAMAMFSQDPAAALLKARDDQLKLAQQYYAPQIAQFDNVIKSDAPTRYVQANPQLMATWQRMAPQLGFDPAKDFTDANVRTAMAFAGNGLKASLNQPTEAPPVQLRQIPGPLGQRLSQDPRTGEVKQEVAPQETAQFLTPQGPRLMTKAEGMAAGYQPFNQVTYGNAQMTGAPGALLAAMDSRGISFPGGGGRSPAMLASRAQALISKYPNNTPDEIADMLRTGQLDFNGAKRSTGQMATLATAADIQMRKLEKDFSSIDPLVAKLPDAPAKINSILTSLKNNWSFGGDKDSAALVGWIKESAGEYAKLISGATGASGAGETSLHDAISQFQTAFSQGGYDGLKSVIMQSGQHRRDAVREGLQAASTPGYATGGAPQSNTGSAHPPDIQDLLSKYGH